jgi:hypothetical protein
MHGAYTQSAGQSVSACHRRLDNLIVPHGSPELAALDDVTRLVTLEFEKWNLNEKPGFCGSMPMPSCWRRMFKIALRQVITTIQPFSFTVH